MIRLTRNYSQQSIIYYGQSKPENKAILSHIRAMINSFAIQTIWVKATRRGNFSCDLLCSIQELINRFYSDDNLQLLETTILMQRNTVEARGILESLTDIFLAIGSLAKRSGQSICIFIEDMHCLKKDEAQTLTMAIHRSNQVRIPLMIFGAGLPPIIRLLGNSRSYAERLYIYSEVASQITEQS